ncbi:class I SAM-dependent methyltransferase [Kaistia terrae]|uniref:Class I SAM-dependent methyltransferase n=1 Tax=Kaistia terrae TaxID=537017 RepID=A0ABW0PP45_9HYPH|nr:class I SAM-dependent methyltransferase [Kaistia terrae]MCX5580183.1 class I SAM-dependent methyltransferase [Kaistia terrae]
MHETDMNAASSTQALFQDQWKIYRKMVDNNFLFHREAYARLHEILLSDVARPFDFLDIACGDASASASALVGTQVAHYHGLDFSAAALALARDACGRLACPASFEEGDFVSSISARSAPVDIVWIGLSLHHLRTAEKGAFMGTIRRLLAPGGRLLIYENTMPDGEDRDGWLKRWDRQRSTWSAYDDLEWNTMRDHVHAADFPETDASWRALGDSSGYGSVLEVYAAPSDLFRMYSFKA